MGVSHRDLAAFHISSMGTSWHVDMVYSLIIPAGSDHFGFTESNGPVDWWQKGCFFHS